MPKRINFAAPRTAGDRDLKWFVFLKFLCLPNKSLQTEFIGSKLDFKQFWSGLIPLISMATSKWPITYVKLGHNSFAALAPLSCVFQLSVCLQHHPKEILAHFRVLPTKQSQKKDSEMYKPNTAGNLILGQCYPSCFK